MNSLIKDTARICQVCEKVFPNGKALGGHMRSHTRTQKLSFLSRKSAKSATSLTIQPLPTSEGANFDETVLVRSVHASAEAGVDLETDLSQEGGQDHSTGGKRKFVWDLNEFSLTAEAEAAEALLILAKGPEQPENVENAKPSDTSVSARKGKEVVECIEIVDSEDEDEEASYYRYLDQDDEPENEDGSTVTVTEDKREEIVIEDEDDEIYLVAKDQNKCKKKFKCDLCGKILRSYQALGGHRTSHRNKRLKMMLEIGESSNSLDETVRRHFPCEICGKVFQSGQALGGHKKVHFMFLKPST